MKHVKVASQEETVQVISMSVPKSHVTLTAHASTPTAHSNVNATMDTPKAAQLHARVGEQIKT